MEFIWQNNWKYRESRGLCELCVRAVVEGFSPTGQQGLSQDGAQVIAGPGEAVISCPCSVCGLCTCGETS